MGQMTVHISVTQIVPITVMVSVMMLIIMKCVPLMEEIAVSHTKIAMVAIMKVVFAI